ncbi:MAG: ABC transporter permease [Thermoflexales bacterium]|nr:ABC transporter permease [Thermoflexales bacterium]
MIGPRWSKVWADLWGNRVRTALVILSIAVGTFAVGLIAGFGAVVEGDMQADFQAANPHHAVISSTPFDSELLRAVQRLPGVARAEGRSLLSARIRGQAGDWQPVQIVAIPPLDEMQIDCLRLVDGTDRPVWAEREMLVERGGLLLLPARPGDRLTIELPSRKTRSLRVAGVVHDATRFPALFSGQLTVFVSPDTLEWLGGSREYNQMLIMVTASGATESGAGEAHIRRVAQAAADKIEASRRQVFQTSITKPGEFPMSFVLRALLVVEGSMAVFMVFLSVFLVVNTITAMLGQHIRQIGIMKAVGAQTPQVMGMYLVLALGFGVLALALAVPLSAVAILGSVGLAGQMMNFIPGPFRMPVHVVALQAAVALGTPLLAALAPILGGTRVTVREAISNYGLGSGEPGQGVIDKVLEKVHLLPRPTLISLRNAFRRRTRVALTLLTLTLGGALFIAVFNLRASFTLTLDETRGYTLSDVNLSLARPYRISSIEPVIKSVPGVERVEAWGVVAGQVLSEDKVLGLGVIIYAPPANSTLIRPALAAGRWLVPQDANALVICNQISRRRPDVQVGDELVTKIQGQEYAWRVVGVCKLPGDVEPGFAYANYEYLARLLGQVGRATDFRIATIAQDASTHQQVARQLEEQLAGMGIAVSNVSTGSELRAQQAVGIDIFLSFMLALAGLIALVGGMGLMGTMSINVLERTREIGVMRAIGASDRAVLQLVIVEGLVIGLMSWLLGTLLAVPISKLFTDAVGIIFLSVPLAAVFSPGGCLVWLGGVLGLSALASMLPARSAARLTIRQSLAYE